ncbi:LamG domain-containing protein [Glycomyces dulcitolivorans]|uniref:LamG domain-containing protein n=1 Tax=Glycomyces dulcitolivorans TaxID=2200759 RepID=UPI0018E56115|nr:LamG domain-containing protein [Glycomyces dulcitolivorans]
MSITLKRSAQRVALAALAGLLAVGGLASPAAAAPTAPVITSDDFPDDDQLHPVLGEIGTITITAVDPDIAYYLVDFNYDSVGQRRIDLDPPSAVVELEFMPTIAGSQMLTVRAVNAAGAGVTTYYDFRVSAKAPVGEWALDEPAGSTAVADANGANLGTPGSGVTLGTDGPGDATAASFDGTRRAFVNTTDKGLLRTDEGFAVSAWVRVDDLARDQAAVSVKSREESGFALGYRSLSATSGEWSFWIPDAKFDPAGEWRVSGGSVRPGTADEWVHLVGVYNQVDQTIVLYVNGTQVGSAVRETVWNAVGDVQIGRARAADAWSYQWNGDIAEPRVFDRYVAAGEAAGLAVYPQFHREGYWQFNGVTDGVSPEYLGGESATLYGDASIYGEPEDPFSGDPFPIAGAGHLLLDGDGDYASAATPQLDTAGSFSLSAKVQPESLTQDMTVLSIAGEHRPLVEVRYNAALGSWELVVAKADAPDAETVSVTSRRGPDAWSPQGIVVVFDGALDQWALYVGGIQAPAVIDGDFDSWSATGGLQIGRSVTGDVSGSYFHGAIDEVRAYTGAIDDYRINVFGFSSGTENPNL